LRSLTAQLWRLWKSCWVQAIQRVPS